MVGYLLFTAAFLISVATPGPDVLAVVGKTLGGGKVVRCAGLIAGIVAGKLLLLAAALAGLIVIVTALGPLFAAIKLAGGVYLVWLGTKFWRKRPLGEPRPVSSGGAATEVGLGLAMSLSNPLAIIFYAALLPNTVDVRGASPQTFAMLAAIVTFCTIAVYAVYAGLAARAGRHFRSPTAQQAINKTSGAAMIGAGMMVAVR